METTQNEVYMSPPFYLPYEILTPSTNYKPIVNINKKIQINEPDLNFSTFASVSIPSSSTNLLAIQIMTPSSVRDLIINPQNFHPRMKVVEVTNTDDMVAAHIPDLSDLSNLHKALQVYICWEIKKVVDDEIVVPTSIAPFIDHPSTIKWVRNDLHLVNIPIVLHYKSMANRLQTIWFSKFEAYRKGIQFSMKWKKLSTHPLDGREYSLSFKIGVDNQAEEGERGSDKFIIWNCRGMGRRSFLHKLRQIVVNITPSFVVFTETRVSVMVAASVLRDVDKIQMCGIDSMGTSAGIIVIVTSGGINVNCKEKESQFLAGTVTFRKQGRGIKV